jgi:hypothetical protein
LLVVKDKNPKTSAALRSLREKKKGFPQRLERHREKRGTTLSSFCWRLKSEQLIKKLNSGWAESYDFQSVFLLARMLLIRLCKKGKSMSKVIKEEVGFNIEVRRGDYEETT